MSLRFDWHRLSPLAAVLAASAVLASHVDAGTLPPEFFNEFDTTPSTTPGPSDFEVFFLGKVAIPTQDCGLQIDPFGCQNGIKVKYNARTNETVVTYSGSPLPPDKREHFGLNYGPQSNPPSVQVARKEWTFAGRSVSVPAPTIYNGLPPPATGTYDFAIIFMYEAIGTVPNAAGTWFEFPFAVGSPLDPLVGNFTKAKITLSDVEYFVSPTEIPLDTLNFASLPPTDPRFLPGGIPNGTILAPGKILKIGPPYLR
jgi:hypothetical protein